MSLITWKPRVLPKLPFVEKVDEGFAKVLGEQKPKSRRISEFWSKKTGRQVRVVFEHLGTRIDQIKADVEKWAESYGIEYKGGNAVLTAQMPERMDDIVTWSSTSTQQDIELRLSTYFKTTDVSQVDRDFETVRCKTSGGALINYTDTKKNQYRDYLLAGITTVKVFRQVITRTTVTSNGSALQDNLAHAGYINSPPLPAGTPITKVGTYLKMAPEVTDNDGTYTVKEEWVQGEWDATLYTDPNPEVIV